MRAVIIANGELNGQEFARMALTDCGYVVACDGGLRHCDALEITPDYIIGDLDSVDSDLLKKYREVPVPVKCFPAEKDQTDLELAIAHACDIGAEGIVVLGGLGGRVDHQLANIFVLTQAVRRGVRAEMCDAHTRVMVIKDYGRLRRANGILVTLLPLTATAVGIVTEGLRYPLNDESLEAGSARGVSNEIKDECASVSLKEGLLLIIQTQPEI